MILTQVFTTGDFRHPIPPSEEFGKHRKKTLVVVEIVNVMLGGLLMKVGRIRRSW